MTDSILAAAGQVNEIETAFELFDAFSAISPPTSDTYAAILKGCISCRMLESVPLVSLAPIQKVLDIDLDILYHCCSCPSYKKAFEEHLDQACAHALCLKWLLYSEHNVLVLKKLIIGSLTPPSFLRC